jgi:hypothetical protein
MYNFAKKELIYYLEVHDNMTTLTRFEKKGKETVAVQPSVSSN